MPEAAEAHEEMGSFFNRVAETYEQHMREGIARFDEYYSAIAEPIRATDNPVEILNLGCGTGLELAWIFKKAPNARITGIDLSTEMTSILREHYPEQEQQIELIHASYLDYPFEKRQYDYILSGMSMHHWTPERKTELYGRIRQALKPGGSYIEGDYIVSRSDEAKFLTDYRKLPTSGKILHIDIPLSLETQKQLFTRAGFGEFRLVFSGEFNSVYAVS